MLNIFSNGTAPFLFLLLLGFWLLAVGIAVVEKSFNFPLTESYEVECVIYRLIHDALFDIDDSMLLRVQNSSSPLNHWFILLFCFVFEQFLFIIIYHYLCAPIQIISRPKAWWFFQRLSYQSRAKNIRTQNGQGEKKKSIIIQSKPCAHTQQQQ